MCSSGYRPGMQLGNKDSRADGIVLVELGCGGRVDRGCLAAVMRPDQTRCTHSPIAAT